MAREVVPNRFLGTNVFITDSQNIAMSQTLSCTCALKNIRVFNQPIGLVF